MLNTEEGDFGAWEARLSDLDGVATLERREGGPSMSFLYIFLFYCTLRHAGL